MPYFWIHTAWITGVALLLGFQGKGSFVAFMSRPDGFRRETPKLREKNIHGKARYARDHVTGAYLAEE